MKTVSALMFGLFTVSLAIAAEESADTKAIGAGRGLYLTYCASCHGASAKGDGPVAQSLKTKVPDLANLPLKEGKFDYDKIRTSVDGQQLVPSHGTREMPVWGKVFTTTKGPGFAQTEIWTLMQYIKSLQQPEPPAPPKE